MKTHENRDDLDTRLKRLTRDCPALLPYFVETVEMLEELEIDVEDVAAVLRIYRRSPPFVHLLLGMMDVAVSIEEAPADMNTA